MERKGPRSYPGVWGLDVSNGTQGTEIVAGNWGLDVSGETAGTQGTEVVPGIWGLDVSGETSNGGRGDCATPQDNSQAGQKTRRPPKAKDTDTSCGS
jgi:hypothetical protein